MKKFLIFPSGSTSFALMVTERFNKAVTDTRCQVASSGSYTWGGDRK